MGKEIKVSICCATYNHEKLIRDAIEGFLIQKTNFPNVFLTQDGVSSDNTTNNVGHNKPELAKQITRKFV